MLDNHSGAKRHLWLSKAGYLLPLESPVEWSLGLVRVVCVPRELQFHSTGNSTPPTSPEKLRLRFYTRRRHRMDPRLTLMPR